MSERKKSPRDIIAEIKKFINSKGKKPADELFRYLDTVEELKSRRDMTSGEMREVKELYAQLKEMSRGDTHSTVKDCVCLTKVMEDMEEEEDSVVLKTGVAVVDLDEAQQQALEKLDPTRKMKKSDVEITGRAFAKGGFGIVYPGVCRGLPVAVKQVIPDDPDIDVEEEEECFKKEALIMSRINHPNCCEFVGYFEDPVSIVTRRYSCTLEELINEGSLSLERRFRFAYQITSGLFYIHSLNLLHRDLKPANIFVDEDDNVKIADFGLTEWMPSKRMKDAFFMGSRSFMAPELLHEEEFTSKCEVFSLGIILFMLFTGRYPFRSLKKEDVYDCFVRTQCKIEYTEEDYSHRPGDGKPPKELFDLLSSCCEFKYQHRPELSVVLSSICDIGVRSVIFGSRHAELFWKKLCYNTYRNHIQLYEFAHRVSPHDPETFIKFLTDAVPSDWKMMDINHFWCLCCWFPNFFNPKRDESYEMMMAIVEALWYARDEKEAKARLTMKKGKALVVCPSTVNPFTFPYNVFTVNDGVKKETIIKRSRGETKVVLSCALLPGREFDTLLRLVAALVKELGYLIAPKLDPDEKK